MRVFIGVGALLLAIVLLAATVFSPIQDPIQLAKRYGNEGSEAMAAGDYERAENLLSTAYKLNPHFIEAHVGQGLALDAMGRHEEADRCFRDALVEYEKRQQLKPDDFDLYVQSSFLHLLLDEMPAMEADLKTAVDKGLEQRIADSIIENATNQRQSYRDRPAAP